MQALSSLLDQLENTVSRLEEKAEEVRSRPPQEDLETAVLRQAYDALHETASGMSARLDAAIGTVDALVERASQDGEDA